MSIIPSNMGLSVAGLGQAERVVSKETAKKDIDKAAGRRAVRDEVDLIVSDVDSADAIRSLKGNTDEETREDKQEHPAYVKTPAAGPAQPSIDVQA